MATGPRLGRLSVSGGLEFGRRDLDPLRLFGWGIRIERHKYVAINDEYKENISMTVLGQSSQLDKGLAVIVRSVTSDDAEETHLF